MNPTSLDKQSGDTQDGNLVRIVRLETQMDNLASILMTLQRTQDEQHRATQSRFDELHKVMIQRTDELQRVMTERTDELRRVMLERTDDLSNRMEKFHLFSADRTDRYVRWMVGIMLANVTATAGLLAKALLT